MAGGVDKRDFQDRFFRPKIHELYADPIFHFLPPLELPDRDFSILHPADGLSIEDIDERFPEFKTYVEKETKFIDVIEELPPFEQRIAKQYVDESKYYGIPGFDKSQSLLDKIFAKPTKTQIKWKKRRVFELASEGIENVLEKPPPTNEEILQALVAGKNAVLSERLRKAGKFAEARALEEDLYDIYMPQQDIVAEESEYDAGKFRRPLMEARVPNLGFTKGRRLF